MGAIYDGARGLEVANYSLEVLELEELMGHSSERSLLRRQVECADERNRRSELVRPTEIRIAASNATYTRCELLREISPRGNWFCDGTFSASVCSSAAEVCSPAASVCSSTAAAAIVLSRSPVVAPPQQYAAPLPPPRRGTGFLEICCVALRCCCCSLLDPYLRSTVVILPSSRTSSPADH
ncbi:hypothetical protein K1719_009474 [Acacia pycnantha]|nr:hypothetical protein K1719_009474 [Acacia pycnantha]